MPKVSVVIPTYNRAHLLGACLESVVRQTYRDFEIVVVDDGSTDNTREVVERVAPLARYVWQENRGIPRAYNRGVQEARGEYILFADSDDQLLEEAMALEAEVLDENPGVGLVYGQAWELNEEGVTTALRRPAFARGRYVRSGLEEIRDLLFSCHVVGSTMAVRRRCFDVVGLFDPRLAIYEDWDMWIRIAKKYDVAHIDKPVAMYRIHSGETGNAFFGADARALEPLRRIPLQRVFDDPGISHLYRGLRGKVFFRHHHMMATRAYAVRDMRFARSQVLQAVKAGPGELLNPGGLSALWLLVSSYIPAPLLGAVKGIFRIGRGRGAVKVKTARRGTTP